MSANTSALESSQKHSSAFITATLCLWLIPLAAFFLPLQEGEPTLALIIAISGLLAGPFVCRAFRQSRWIVMIWTPLLAWNVLGAWTILSDLAQEACGGGNAGPLAGLACAIGLAVAVVLGIAAILTLIWRPRQLAVSLVTLAVVNTGLVSYATRTANRRATGQEIVLNVLDSNGRPLSGASIQFIRYGYGPQGTSVYDGRGGPLLSGTDGIVKIPSRLMRYETQGTIIKAGYRRVFFTLEMQFSEWDKTRILRISTDQTRDIARLDVPATNPVTFPIYLPPQSDTPTLKHPAKGRAITADIGHGTDAKHFLDLKTGKFGAGPDGDLRFDVFFERENDQREYPQLRITGIHGAKVSQVPPIFSLQRGQPSYENVFRIAPIAGYQDDTAIQYPGAEPGPMIYVAARDGKLYARLTADVMASRDGDQATCRVNLFTNFAGSRLLE